MSFIYPLVVTVTTSDHLKGRWYRKKNNKILLVKENVSQTKYVNSWRCEADSEKGLQGSQIDLLIDTGCHNCR